MRPQLATDAPTLEVDTIRQDYIFDVPTIAIITPEVEIQKSDTYPNFVHYKEADVTFASRPSPPELPFKVKIIDVYDADELIISLYVYGLSGCIIIGADSYVYGEVENFDFIGHTSTDTVFHDYYAYRIVVNGNIYIDVDVSHDSKLIISRVIGDHRVHISKSLCEYYTFSMSSMDLSFDIDGAIEFRY